MFVLGLAACSGGSGPHGSLLPQSQPQPGKLAPVKDLRSGQMVIPKTSIKYTVRASDALAKSIRGGSTGGGMRTMGALDCGYTFLEATPGVEDPDTDTLIDIECDDGNDPGNFDCSNGGCPSGGSGGGGGSVAYQGTAQPGKPCLGGSGANSAPVGLPMGQTDTGTGPGGDEVNNIYMVNLNSGNGAGAVQGNGGFLLTTFGGETWYQLPIALPLYNGPVYIDLGNNISISDGGIWGTANLYSAISNALSNQSGNVFTDGVIDEIKSELNNLEKQGTNASTPDCFNGAWDGKTIG